MFVGNFSGSLSSVLLVITAIFVSGCNPAEWNDEELAKEAAGGNSEAQFHLGKRYLTGGDKTPKNLEEAARWLSRAAERNHPVAQFELGQLYISGRGVIEDKEKGFELYRSAAKKGVTRAQYALGKRHTLGQGLPQDFTEAVKWYRMAAKQGHGEAQYSLALRYARGEGVPVDDKAAVKWYERASKQGILPAQVQLAQRYATGEGATKNALEAYKWAVIVGDLGLQQRLAKSMTTQEIATAEKHASSFQPVLEIDIDAPPQSDALIWVLGFLVIGTYGGAGYYWWRKRKRGNYQGT